MAYRALQFAAICSVLAGQSWIFSSYVQCSNTLKFVFAVICKLNWQAIQSSTYLSWSAREIEARMSHSSSECFVLLPQPATLFGVL